MNIEVTVNIPALDRLVDVLKAGVSLPAVAAADAPKTENKPRAKPETKTETKVDNPPAATETAKPETTASDTAEDLLGKVKETAMVLSQKKGRDALMALLAEFGASNISGVPVDQHSAFIAEATSRAAA